MVKQRHHKAVKENEVMTLLLHDFALEWILYGKQVSLTRNTTSNVSWKLI